MDYPKRETTPLAWTSLTFGLLAIVFLAVALIGSAIPRFGTFLSNLGLPNWLTIGFFLVVGILAVLFGLAAIVAITRNQRRGWIPAIAGILLGVLDILIGLAGLAVSSIQFNIGPF